MPGRYKIRSFNKRWPDVVQKLLTIASVHVERAAVRACWAHLHGMDVIRSVSLVGVCQRDTKTKAYCYETHMEHIEMLVACAELQAACSWARQTPSSATTHDWKLCVAPWVVA